MGLEKLNSHMQKNKTGPQFYNIKVNSKCVKHLNVKLETSNSKEGP